MDGLSPVRIVCSLPKARIYWMKDSLDEGFTETWTESPMFLLEIRGTGMITGRGESLMYGVNILGSQE